MSSTNVAYGLKEEKLKLPFSFYSVLIGDLFSRIGDYIYQLAIPLYILYLTGSSIWMGLAFAIDQSALIVTGLIAGTIVDRGRPKQIILVTAAFQTVLVLSLPILYYLDFVNIYLIFVVGFLLISANFLYRTSINSLMPSMMDKSLLPRASGQFSISRSISKTFGPLIASFLIALFNPINSLWIDGLTFLIIFVLMGFVKTEKFEISNTKTKVEENKKSFWQDVKEGFSLVIHTKNVLSMTIFNFFLNLGFVAMFAMLIFHLKETLNLNTSEIGFVFAADGLGAFIAGIFLPRLMEKVKNGYLVLFTALIMGVSILTVGFVNNVFLVGILFGLVMFSSQVNNRTMYTIWQMQIPKNQLGRIFSLSSMIESISVPIAGFLAGVIVEHFGSRNLMIGSGLILIITFVLFLLFSNLKEMDNRVS